MNTPASIISFVRCQPRGWLWKALTATGEEICEQETELPLVAAMALCIAELQTTGDIEPKQCTIDGLEKDEQITPTATKEGQAAVKAVKNLAPAARQPRKKGKHPPNQGPA